MSDQPRPEPEKAEKPAPKSEPRRFWDTKPGSTIWTRPPAPPANESN